MLREKLVAAGIGNRPVVFMTTGFYSGLREEIVWFLGNNREASCI